MEITEIANSFDLIVIGAGPAGLAGARKALNLKKRVLLIDWGEHIDPHYSALQKSDKDHVVGGLGGTARVWGGQFGLISAEDEFNWRIDGKFDEKFFRELKSELSTWLIEMGFKEIEIEKELAGPYPQFRETFTIIPERSGVLEIFDTTITDSNLTYLPNKKLLHIEDVCESSRKLYFEDETVTSSTTPILLALGCIQSTEVILKSLRSNRYHIESEIGSYLADHPSKYGGAYKIHGKGHKLPPELFGNNQKKKFELVDFNSKTGYFQSGIFEIRKLVTPIILNPANHGFFCRANIASILLKLLGNRRLSEKIRTTLQIWYQIEQHRNENSRIIITNEGVQSNWVLGNEDLELFEKLEKYAECEMKQYSVKPHKIKGPEAPETLEQAFHPSGTLPVTSTTKKGIVNQYGKTENLNNVWVASSANFPTSGWVNPSLMIMSYAGVVVENIFRQERVHFEI